MIWPGEHPGVSLSNDSLHIRLSSCNHLASWLEQVSGIPWSNGENTCVTDYLIGKILVFPEKKWKISSTSWKYMPVPMLLIYTYMHRHRHTYKHVKRQHENGGIAVSVIDLPYVLPMEMSAPKYLEILVNPISNSCYFSHTWSICLQCVISMPFLRTSHSVTSKWIKRGNSNDVYGCRARSWCK